MKKKKMSLAGALAGVLVVCGFGSGGQAQTVASLPRISDPIASVGAALPLPAWTEFCQRYPGECAVDLNEAMVVDLTPRAYQAIAAVNRRVNASITPMTDRDHWGVADKWDIPTDGYGDCEDFQLLKRKMLVEAGLPRRAMRMTVVIDEKNEGHAVLSVKTNRGDLILDNKTDDVLTWLETGYVFVKRESQDAQAWVSLGRAVSPVTTANRR